MVKRIGNLVPQICRFDNLCEAFLRAAKGKGSRHEVIEFRHSLNRELSEMASELADGRYKFSPYRKFTIFDPKKRTICAAAFRDRVAFHAMMRICHNAFDNYQIYDSYASRVGKGVYAAIDRAREFARGNTWFLKVDVCKYFDSIDQDVLLAQLFRLFKDPLLLSYFHDLLDTYETAPGKGLPIGNLTSQYFANHYLALADHYCKESMGVRCLVRYMDDVLMFSDNKNELLQWGRQYSLFLSEQLKLSVHPLVLNKVSFGVPFLGYVIFPRKIRLNTNSRRRFIARMGARKKDLLSLEITQSKYVERVSALYSFIEKADVKAFKAYIREKGLFP